MLELELHALELSKTDWWLMEELMVRRKISSMVMDATSARVSNSKTPLTRSSLKWRERLSSLSSVRGATGKPAARTMKGSFSRAHGLHLDLEGVVDALPRCNPRQLHVADQAALLLVASLHVGRGGNLRLGVVEHYLHLHWSWTKWKCGIYIYYT